MKVLENLKFSEFSEMNDREMKLTLGGSGGSGYGSGYNECYDLTEQVCRSNPSCTGSSGVSGTCGWVAVWNACACASVIVG